MLKKIVDFLDSQKVILEQNIILKNLFAFEDIEF